MDKKQEKLENQPEVSLVQMLLTAEGISEITAYGGFPIRYPHWKWGSEYEILHQRK